MTSLAARYRDGLEILQVEDRHVVYKRVATVRTADGRDFDVPMELLQDLFVPVYTTTAEVGGDLG